MLRRVLAFVVIVVIYCALPAAILTLARFGGSLDQTPRYLLVAGGLGLLMTASPIRLNALRLARRLLAGSAEQILARTKDGLAFYLRSFGDDELPEGERPAGLWRFFAPRGVMFGSRPEERLVIVANGVGPLVALGRPGERLPQIGAARLYVKHGEDGAWQQVVRDLCARAALVILQVGKVTPGLGWELNNVPTLVPPERLLLYLPRHAEHDKAVRQQDYTVFRTAYPQLYGKPFPEQLGDARCIVFDPDGTPHLIDPWSLPIRSNVGVLNEDHGIFLKPADLGLDSDSLSLISAIERNFPAYTVPREPALPIDLRICRAFETSLGPTATLVITAGLASLIWPGWHHRVGDWIARWL